MKPLALLDDEHRIRRLLFWYWIIMPLALFAWILLGASNSNMSLQDTLLVPFFAVAFLSGCLSLLLAGLLKLAGHENDRTERTYTLYALVVQILAGNLPGALGCYLLLRATQGAGQAERFAPHWRWLLVTFMVLLALLSLLILLVNLSLWLYQ